MPGRYLSRNRRQTAVYWANPVNPGDGSQTFDTPVEVDVRWEERQELFTDAEGVERVSNAVVFVGSDMVVDEYLFLGELTDLASSEEADPNSVANTQKIRGFRKIPDIRNKYFERKVFL
jgi:hypothetical protein